VAEEDLGVVCYTHHLVRSRAGRTLWRAKIRDMPLARCKLRITPGTIYPNYRLSGQFLITQLISRQKIHLQIQEYWFWWNLLI